MSEPLKLITNLFDQIDAFSYDSQSISQEKLDIANKSRTSLFPWRGQFSPELVELLLDQYSQDTSVILDPFVGSGTTIFESARKGLKCYASEINPAAVEIAKTSQFMNVELAARKEILQRAESIAEECLLPFKWDLFSYQLQKYPTYIQPDNSVDKLLRKILYQGNSNNPLVHNILANAVIRYMNYRSPKEVTDLLRALREHSQIVNELNYSKHNCSLFHTDARSIPLADSSIDLVITSPPYINVFNYHQNNRPAMELMGWNLLEVAKSEMGSNRKNRQNRFLTVVQYALDMLDALKEMRRLLRPNGRVIIIIGRKSNIRGISLENGKLVAAIAVGGAGLSLEKIQERKFKNKFGEIIYEDILHLVPASVKIIAGDNFARLVATWMLIEASKFAEGQVLSEVLEATERASDVKKSPLFKLNTNRLTFSN